jgi:hypothetical protein
MTTSNVQAFIITSDMASLIRDGASKTKTAEASKEKAAAVIAKAGGRGSMFTKEAVAAGTISKETFKGLQTTIAGGLLTAPQFALWSMDSKAANKAGLQIERNKLTSLVSVYVSTFRAKIETAFRSHNPEAAKLEAEAAKLEADAAEKKATAEAEAAAKLNAGAELRKRLTALILDVSAVTFKGQKEVLEALNDAEMLMSTW